MLRAGESVEAVCPFEISILRIKMNYVFALIMLIAAMIGGSWMIKISINSRYDVVAVYAILGLIWGVFCFGVMFKVL